MNYLRNFFPSKKFILHHFLIQKRSRLICIKDISNLVSEKFWGRFYNWQNLYMGIKAWTKIFFFFFKSIVEKMTIMLLYLLSQDLSIDNWKQLSVSLLKILAIYVPNCFLKYYRWVKEVCASSIFFAQF